MEFECPTEGGVIHPNGFKGEIKCPKYSEICGFKDNEICNEIFECLKKENDFLIKEKQSSNNENNEDASFEKETLINFKYLLILLYIFICWKTCRHILIYC